MCPLLQNQNCNIEFDSLQKKTSKNMCMSCFMKFEAASSRICCGQCGQENVLRAQLPQLLLKMASVMNDEYFSEYWKPRKNQQIKIDVFHLSPNNVLDLSPNNVFYLPQNNVSHFPPNNVFD